MSFKKIKLNKIVSLIKQQKTYHKKRARTIEDICLIVDFKTRDTVYKYIKYAKKTGRLTQKDVDNWHKLSRKYYKIYVKKKEPETKTYCKTQVSFNEARKIVSDLKITSRLEFEKLKKRGHPLLVNLPSNPDRYYGTKQ